jgi:hypothetical protein
MQNRTERHQWTKAVRWGPSNVRFLRRHDAGRTVQLLNIYVLLVPASD